jgi:2-methylcitrate dehydratase PrpD
MTNSSAAAPASTIAEHYARYALDLRYEDLPASVISKARHCLVDALGCGIFGASLPWSQIILAEAQSTGSGGGASIPGVPGVRLHPPQAALALGAFSHAFELDSLRKPGAGVHAGATVALPAFALAEVLGASDEDLICAIVAGTEAMFRLGAATLHTPEKVGFHAPGLTGPFGAALAASRLMRLSHEQTANALGIAGSFASGLLAFAASGQGGMIKRLHMGRAAEGGVTAARLAARGFEAPHAVIEGRFGLLDAFCTETDQSLLLDGLGERYELEKLCLKRYACHITAHAPVEWLRCQMADRGFDGSNIESIVVRGSPKLLSHHSNKEPDDLTLAQYSLPFVLALSAFHDPEDPAVFLGDALHDAEIRDLCRRIDVGVREGAAAKGWGVEIDLLLRDGSRISGVQETFLGTPDRPFSDEDIERKFLRLSAKADKTEVMALLRRFLPR